MAALWRNLVAAVERAAGVLALLALAVAVTALVLTLWRGHAPADESYTAAQRADAKAQACANAGLVRNAVMLNTNRALPENAGTVGTVATAANARIALFNGGQYLLARLTPATPPDLAASIRDFGNALMDVGAAAIAETPNTDPKQAQRLSKADELSKHIVDLCK
ncbi:hypothetical protein [Mycobacteroides salmoniphilum]|uniref:hypothetical protein n=1 Tax=Mycobacteroides salmoniphilum TaxID=404941 RepID=UPI0010C57222|nr:hypothetical protein [Mycobacteroides salmoniphilum]QCH25857.1 hypothetical protein DSM43276_04143 [Mycobacteroides salmoniphilum]